MTGHRRHFRFCSLGLVAAAMIGVAPLATAVSSGPLPLDAWSHPAGDAQLDAIRGGFDSGNGLLASFGIDRVVYVNGNLATHTRVSIPDIGHMTAAQAHALAAADGVLTVVQVGPGNTSALVPTGTAAATLIQNSLDGQHIQSLTTIDASVDHLDQFRSARLADTLQDALIQSLGH